MRIVVSASQKENMKDFILNHYGKIIILLILIIAGALYFRGAPKGVVLPAIWNTPLNNITFGEFFTTLAILIFLFR